MPKLPPPSPEEINHQHLVLGLVERQHDATARKALQRDRRVAQYWLLSLQTVAVLGAIATAVISAASGTLGAGGGLATGVLSALAFGLQMQRRNIRHALAGLLSRAVVQQERRDCSD